MANVICGSESGRSKIGNRIERGFAMHIYRHHIHAIIAITLTSLLAVLLAPQARGDAQAQTDTPDSTPVLDEAAAAWLAQAQPDDTNRFIITFKPTEAQAEADGARTVEDKATRINRVSDALTRQMNDQIGALQRFVQTKGIAQELRDQQSFAIANSVAVTAGKHAVDQLATMPQVEVISLNEVFELDEEALTTSVTADPAPAPNTAVTYQPNIKQIRADRAHTELGINGSGAIVGIIDSGVRWTHEALQPNYWCTGYTSHLGCWHDATDKNYQIAPYDDLGHGTGMAGIAVGQNGYGVAPGAKWIACQAYTPSVGLQTHHVLECMQWMLAPDSHPEWAPDVVNNSYGRDDIANDAAMKNAINNLLSAGTLMVFNSGNDADEDENGNDTGIARCNTVDEPAAYSPGVIAVGAVKSNGTIAVFSSRGPAKDGSIKPDFVAPGGDDVHRPARTADNAYTKAKGTSSSAAHITGLIALMRDASPGLANIVIYLNMMIAAESPSDYSCGGVTGGADNVYGSGLVDAFNAVKQIMPPVTPTPTKTPTKTPTATPTKTPTLTPTMATPIIKLPTATPKAPKPTDPPIFVTPTGAAEE
jgi:bacillopeptidase F